jgi:hypothetical protein
MDNDKMDLVNYRLEQSDRHAATTDARMERIEDKLNAIQLTLGGLATKDTVRGWGVAVVAIVIASAFSASAIMLQSTGNQLSAFQAGLSAVQAAGPAAHAAAK